MNKYVLTLAAALLIAAAPAYYAFQAQAEEAVPAAAEPKEGDVITCDTLPEDADAPDECIEAQLEKAHGHDAHEDHGDHDDAHGDHAAPEKAAE